MLDFFGHLFDSSGFVPRKECGDWSPGLLWLHVGSDLFIWLAYLSIPLVLVYFLRKQRNLPFPKLFGLFAVFILACGFTHFLDALMFEKPMYRLAGLVKFVTAVVSWATVVALISAVPKVIEAAGALPAVPADTTQHSPVSGKRADRKLDYIVAVLAAVLAILVRGALDPILRTDHVFVVSLLAVVFVSWQYGFGPGLTCLVVSMLGFVFFFVSSPRFSLTVVGLDNQLAIGLFFFCGVGCCGLGEAQRFARRREKRALAESLEKRDALEREVTRRKMIEHDLRQREEDVTAAKRHATEALAQLDALFDNAPVSIAFLDPDLRYRRVNAALAGVNARAAESFLGKTMREAVPDLPADVEAVYRATAVPGAKPVTRVRRYPDAKDPDRVRTWQVTTFPVCTSADTSLGVGVIAEDVTDRERAAEALRDSEGYLRSVLDNSPDCVKVLSVDGRLAEMNRPGLCLMEIDDFEPFKGKEWASLWPDNERTVRAAVATAAAGQLARFQGPAATATGTMKYWDVQVAPIPGPDGKPTRLVSVSRDITEQRRNEEAVRHSEATLRAFYDNSPLNMGIVELTYDGDIRHVYDNSASCRFFGAPAGGTAGKLASALGATPHTIETWRKYYRQSAATGKAVQFDHTFDAPDGTRWLAVTVSAIPTPTGHPTRYCYVAEDVTEKQRVEREMRLSEARFRTLAAAVPQVVWVTGADGAREYHNARWSAYTGLTEAESNGWNWLDALHPDDRAESEARWRHSVATGDEYQVARRIRGADGEYRWFLGRALPQTDEAGKIVRWFGTCTDIHDAKVTEEQVRALNAELAARMGELQSVLDAAPAAIWIARDPDCRDVTGNRTSFELLHTPSTENVSASVAPEHRRFREYRGGVPIPPDQLPLQLAARTGQAQANVELELRFDDGDVKHVYGSTAPLLDPDGKPRGALGVFIDVTGQKKTAAALQQRDAEFRLMADNIPPLAWMARPDGHIFWYNRRWYEYTGTTPDQMEGWGWKAVHDPGVLPEVMVGWQKSIDTGTPFEMVFPLKGANGRFRTFLTRVFPATEGGRVVRWFGTNTDITDQLEAAEKLRASEERFRTLTEAVPSVVWNADADGQPTYFNTRWTEYTGIDMDDLQSVGQLGWLIAAHPEDHDRVKAAWLDTVTNVAGGQADRFTHEVRFRRAGTDDYRWFLTVAVPLRRPDGTIDQWIGSMADIHDQKSAAELVEASAERFRLLTESVPQMVWTADAGGVVRSFNRRWTEYTGLALGTGDVADWGHVIHPDDTTRVDANWRMAVAQGVDFYTQDFRLRRTDGEFRWMLTAGNPRRDAAGAVVEWVGSITDIHDQKTAAENLENTVRDRTAQLEQTNAALLDEIDERKRAEEQVAATARELKRSNEELEQFAYIASHDLQEPLRKIQSFGDLLKTKYRDQLPDGGKEYADKMLTSAARMRRLIDDLLSLSRITSQAKPYARADLTELAEQVKGDLDYRLDQLGATIEISPLPAVDADPAQIRQLFQNLFSNALKFSRPGVAPVVRVWAESISPDAVQIAVEDNGIGFEEKYRDRIFQVFQRLHGRDEYEGTGVGLAICQKIVERHRGTITAHGRPGDGATFVVTLPVSQPNKDLPNAEYA